MKRVATAPHVLYEAGKSADGRWLIQCRCNGCGDRWHRPCQFPERTGEWIQRYVNLHSSCTPASGAAARCF